MVFKIKKCFFVLFCGFMGLWFLSFNVGKAYELSLILVRGWNTTTCITHTSAMTSEIKDQCRNYHNR